MCQYFQNKSNYSRGISLFRYDRPILMRYLLAGHQFCVISCLYPVYTIQPVVKMVVQPVGQPVASCKRTSNRVGKPVVQSSWQPVGCLFTRYSRLSNRLYNWTAGCTTGFTTGWMFVYTTQPVVQRVVKPVWQQVVSCQRSFSDIVNSATICCSYLLSDVAGVAKRYAEYSRDGLWHAGYCPVQLRLQTRWRSNIEDRLVSTQHHLERYCNRLPRFQQPWKRLTLLLLISCNVVC